MLSSPIRSTLGPLVRGFQDWVNVFTLAITEVFGGQLH